MTEQMPDASRSHNGSLLRIQLLGIVSLILWMFVVAGFGILYPEPYADTWQIALGQLVAGRAFSVSAGLNAGFNRIFLLFQCSIQDILILLLLYPVLVGGYRRIVEVAFVGPAIANIRAAAERHKSRVAQFGALGLAAFVFFPFWSTGALAGGVIGYLLGMRIRIVFPAVIIGEMMAVACWIWLFNQMREFSETVGQRLPLIVLILVVVFAAIFRIRNLRKRARSIHHNSLRDK